MDTENQLPVIKSPTQLIKEITELKHYQLGGGQGSFIGYVTLLIDREPVMTDDKALPILKTILEMAKEQYGDQYPPAVNSCVRIAKVIEAYV